jgi:CP family cyanate transporter-like MFS transporter
VCGLDRARGPPALLCGGIVLRTAPPVVALFAGRAVVGTSIALLNVLMPGLIKRDFPDRAAGMTALYSTAMILGATVSAATAVPLESALGARQGSHRPQRPARRSRRMRRADPNARKCTTT